MATHAAQNAPRSGAVREFLNLAHPVRKDLHAMRPIVTLTLPFTQPHDPTVAPRSTAAQPSHLGVDRTRAIALMSGRCSAYG